MLVWNISLLTASNNEDIIIAPTSFLTQRISSLPVADLTVLRRAVYFGSDKLRNLNRSEGLLRLTGYIVALKCTPHLAPLNKAAPASPSLSAREGAYFYILV